MKKLALAALLAVVIGHGAWADAFSSIAPYFPPRTYATGTYQYWVTAAGNDSNDCLTFATGCATIQAAVNKALSKVDAGNAQTVIVNLQATTFTGAVSILGSIPGNGWLWIVGAGAGATITSSGSADTLAANYRARVLVQNVTLKNTGTGACLSASNASTVTINTNVVFGQCGAAQIDSQSYANIAAGASYTIAGNGGVLASSHLHSHSGGLIQIDGVTVTCTGTPAFTNYFAGASWSYIEAIGTTFSGCGLVVGPHFTANRNAGIRTNTNDLNFFPGNSPGTLSGAAAYDDFVAPGIIPRTITTGTSDTANSADQAMWWKVAAGGAKTQTLPQCTSSGPFQPFIVQDAQGDAATNNITVSAPSSTINGAANKVINTNYGILKLQCDGAGNYMVQ